MMRLGRRKDGRGANVGTRARGVLRPLLVLLPLLWLAGCGLAPMYGEQTAGGSAARGWQLVDVMPPADRLTQLVYNELLRYRPPERRGTGSYLLRISVQEEDAALLGSRLQRLRLNTSFALTRRADGRVLLQGRTHGDASYHVTRMQVADAQARAAARRTAAKLVAADIRTRVGAFFAGAAQASPATSPVAASTPAPMPASTWASGPTSR